MYSLPSLSLGSGRRVRQESKCSMVRGEWAGQAAAYHLTSLSSALSYVKMVERYLPLGVIVRTKFRIQEPYRNILYQFTKEESEVQKPAAIAQGTQLVGSQAQNESQGFSVQRMFEQLGGSRQPFFSPLPHSFTLQSKQEPELSPHMGVSEPSRRYSKCTQRGNTGPRDRQRNWAGG